MTPEVIEGEIVGGGPPAVQRPHRSVNVWAVVAVVLLLAVGVLGSLLVRQRSAQDEERRHLRNQSTRAAQRAAAINAELAVVRAQRDEAVGRLARAERLGLSPEMIAALRACVQRYAELERTPGGVPPLAEPVCIAAEPYVR